MNRILLKSRMTGLTVLLAVALLFIGSLAFSLIVSQALSSSWLFRSFFNISIDFNVESANEDAQLVLRSFSTYPVLSSCDSINESYQNTSLNLNYLITTDLSFTPNPRLAFSSLINNLARNNTQLLELIDTSSLNPFGTIMIDSEQIFYRINDTANNQLKGLTRGYNNTFAGEHFTGSLVSQYDCLVTVSSTLPDTGSPRASKTNSISSRLVSLWTSGNSGINLNWNYPVERNWTSIVNPDLTNTNDISLINYTDGWLVGDTTAGDLNIKKWDILSQNWLPSNPGLTLAQNLFSVSTVSSTEAWAVGNNNATDYTLVKYNGGTIDDWCLVPTNPAGASPCANTSIISTVADAQKPLYAIKVIDNSNDTSGELGFAVGGSLTTAHILQFDGLSATWSDANLNITNSGRLFGIDIVKNPAGLALEAFAVGRLNSSDLTGVIIRWDFASNTWNEQEIAIPARLNSIAVFDSNQDGLADFGLAVGQNGTVVVYNGTNWVTTTVGTNELLDVTILSTNDAWAVGVNGTRLHYDGAAWTEINDGVATALSLNSISGV